MEFSFDVAKRNIINKQYNGYLYNTYGAAQNRILTGYITEKTEQTAVSQTYYKVVIPELMFKEVEAFEILNLGQTGVNGIGEKHVPPPIGTWVILMFIGQSDQAAILGTRNLPGQDYYSTITSTREFKGIDAQVGAWRGAMNMATLELGTESKLTVYPFHIRGGNNLYSDERVTTGNEVPGSFEVHGENGMTYTFDPTAKVQYMGNSITKIQGKLKTYSDKAIDSLQRQYQLSRERIERSLERQYIFADGEIIPGNVAKAINTLSTYSGTVSEALNFLEEVNKVVDTALRYLEIGAQFLEWISQDIGTIIDDLLQTFGSFQFNLGMATINISLSLNSIDFNLDFRLGSGIPLVDTIVNTVVETVVNTIVQEVLDQLNLGELLGGLQGLFGGDTVDVDSTFAHNVLNPILRLTGSLSGGQRNLRQILGNVNNLTGANFNVSEVWRLDDETYLTPEVIMDTSGLDLSDDLVKLSKMLVTYSADPSLFYLPAYLLDFYTYQTECDIVAATFFASSNQEDKLKTLFLYGYYTQNEGMVEALASTGYSSKRVNTLTSRYDWSSKDTYTKLNMLDVTDIYDPELLDLDAFASSLSESTKVALDYLLDGQIASYIVQLIIIRTKRDIRFTIDRYRKLQKLINTIYPEFSIGYDIST